MVIPTYNEAERILPTLGAMAVIVSGLGYRWELIVSDDGSKDGTADLVEGLGWKNLRVVRHANTGKGGAVQRGVLASKGQRVLFADADNSTPIEELPRLMGKLDEGYDLAVGSRVGEGASEENKSALRKLVSWGLRFVARALSGVAVRDTQCGFKLFGPRASRLFQLQKMQGFSFDLELLYLAHKFGYQVAEIPVRWFDAPGSKVNSVQDSVKFLKDIFALRQLDRQGAYQRGS
ncbi:dolichyl-phosphate beta-glucosyltransferase [Deinococcus malanensis]|uniref:dolichyl-phosphate beta-glucosyltransferase n=1 Tax=Deinococcus malanensis TaxID=1706855 RepID=UPI00363EDA2C